MSCFSVTEPFLITFYYVVKQNGILRKNRGEGFENLTYPYMGVGEVENCQNHPYVINEWLHRLYKYNHVPFTLILCLISISYFFLSHVYLHETICNTIFLRNVFLRCVKQWSRHLCWTSLFEHYRWFYATVDSEEYDAM